MAVFGLLGAGGLAREVMPAARHTLRAHGIEQSGIFFVDRQAGTPLHGHLVVSEADFLAHPDPVKYYCAAIGNGRVRAQMEARMNAAGALPLTIMAADAQTLDGNAIAPGALLCPGSIITVDATVGRSFVCDRGGNVSHDCVIGDYVTFHPGVQCSGNVTIEDFATIGAGALIKQGLRIGAGAMIGMGAAVIRDVPPGATVAGNPARVL